MKIVLAGGGRVGALLAARLMQERHAVTVVERDRAACERLFEELGVLTVAGDATDPRALQDAGLRGADIAIGVLARDADNLAFASLARAMSDARIMVRMLDDAYRDAYRLAGVRELVAEADLVVGRMATAIEFPQIQGSLPLPGGDAIVFELSIGPRALVNSKTVAQVRADERFPRDCVFIGFADAQGGIELPTGTSVLRAGQVAIVVARRAQLAAAVAFLSEQPALQGDSASLLPALRRIDFLATLDEADLQELARGVRTVRLRAGETVFNKGDPGDYFYLVLSGAVGLYVEEGRVHETVQPGGFFGEISLLTGEPRSATARASSDCELGAIARDEFRAVAMRTPAVALEMTRVLGQRLASMARTQPAPEKPRRFFGR